MTKILNIICVFYVVLFFTGCASTAWNVFSEKDIIQKQTNYEGLGFLGINLSFMDIPADLDWNLNILLHDVKNDEPINITILGEDITANKVMDNVPIVLSLPAGLYAFKQISLEFPKNSSNMYYMAEEKIILPIIKPMPILQLVEKQILFMGEIKINQSKFIPRKPGYATSIYVNWDAWAVPKGVLWESIGKKLPIYMLSPNGKKNKKALLIYDKPSEVAIATFASGFAKMGEPQSLVVVGSNVAGVALFEKNNTLERVTSQTIGEEQVFAIIGTKDEKITLRGFCFDSIKEEDCNKENFIASALTNKTVFNAGEIRFRGYINKFAKEASSIVEEAILNKNFEESLKKQISFTNIKSFVYGADVQKYPVGSFVFFTSKGEKNKWDLFSLPILTAFNSTAIACYKNMRNLDPFITTDFDIIFSLNTTGVMQSIGQKGLIDDLFLTIKPCFDVELAKFTINKNAEIANGFGIRYKH